MRETPVNGYGKTQISTTSVQSGEPEVNWFFERTPEIGQICFRNCYSTDHLHQDASTPEEIKKLGVLEERLVWTNCDAPRKGIRAKQFESSWWTSDELWHAKTTNWTQKNLLLEI